MPAANSRPELTARLSYVDFDGAEALIAIADTPLEASRLDDFVATHCPRVMEGVRRTAESVRA